MESSNSARSSRSSAQPATLIAFYEGLGRDSGGRRLSEILEWGDNKLESSHDYIQTLFPLPERSGVNDRAPTIDKQVFDAFRARKELRENLRNAFGRMMWFYGFQIPGWDNGKLIVVKGPQYTRSSRNWLTRFDHNHLRITRIIRCLRVLGLEEEALAFYDAVHDAKIVSERSRMYWERAAHRPLNIRPDVEEEDIDEETMGPNFLRDFEKEKRNNPKADFEVENDANNENNEHDESSESEENDETDTATTQTDSREGNEPEGNEPEGSKPTNKTEAEVANGNERRESPS